MYYNESLLMCRVTDTNQQLITLIYYINVQSQNLDLKLGIKPKAGNFLSGKREGGRETEIEDRDRWEKQKDRGLEIER